MESLEPPLVLDETEETLEAENLAEVKSEIPNEELVFSEEEDLELSFAEDDFVTVEETDE